ncbi:hypothetical protein GOV06_03415 [Candidatus Woesearchaeota archaeon]|nr:hypothetical protein [Candidatus Woesearchaeota archaeon]
MDYKEMYLEEFIKNLPEMDTIKDEKGRKVSPYLSNPTNTQKRLIVKGAKDLVYNLRTGKEKGTVVNVMTGVLYQCGINDVIRMTQCYLAMIPVVINPKDERITPGEFNDLVIRYYVAVQRKDCEEPLLFADLNKTSKDLDAISTEIQQKKHYDFNPTDHNKDQANSIVRNARDGNEFISVFYEKILMPTLRLPIRK